jgi:hypothetical protein
MTLAGIKARGIHVALAGADSERKPLGLPSAWPSDGLLQSATNVVAHAQRNFDNSTDYFRFLYESKACAGFDYEQLACGQLGIPPCRSGRPLTACNNMWTIAKNIRDDMDDTLPVLITRNVDAASLPVTIFPDDREKRLRFDPDWRTPFSNKGFVLVRKGGAIFKAREKYATYRYVYQSPSPLAASGDLTEHNYSPLTYLAPTYEVANGVKKYSVKAYRDILAAHRVTASDSGSDVGALREHANRLTRHEEVRNKITFSIRLLMISAAIVGTIYALFWFLFVHGFVTSAFFALYVDYIRNLYSYDPEWTAKHWILAFVSWIGGSFIISRQPSEDSFARQRRIKWMAAAPLVACAILLVLWAVLNLFFCLLDACGVTHLLGLD